MPDISYQMQLRQAANNSPMQALDTLMNTVGNTWQRNEGRTDQQDAVSFFMKTPVSPESIQEFSASHPNMPLVDVYRSAGAMVSQKKAKEAKDYFTSLQSYLSGGGDPDPEKLQEIASQYKNLSPSEIMEMSNGVMKQTNFMEDVKKKREANTRQKGLTSEISAMTAPVTKVTPGNLAEAPEDMAAVTETTMPKINLDKLASVALKYIDDPKEALSFIKDAQSAKSKGAIDLKFLLEHGDKWSPETLNSITGALGIPLALVQKAKEAKVPQIRTVDLGDKTEIYKDGVLVETKAKGKVPAIDPDSKPSRVAYRDKTTGAINYYDKNNPADRETLRRDGKKLVPILENPITSETREALSSVPQGKVLDAAKAGEYLRGAGGDKEKARKAAKADGYSF